MSGYCWMNGKSSPPDVTSPYGYSPGYGKEFHFGLDTIDHYYNHAIGDGEVIYVGWSTFGGGGWEVWYRLDNGDVIVYYHNRRGLLVARGDRVEAGTRLGVQSNTGGNYGIHCHTEVWLNGRRDSRTDPYEYISNLVGSKPAGGGSTPIITADERENDMDVRYVHRTEGAREFMIVGPTLGQSLDDAKQDGYRVTTDVLTAQAWGAIYGTSKGDSWKGLTRDQYIRAQENARKIAADYRRLLKG